MNHLTTLRTIAALARSTDPRVPIDADLDREAGMDGNLARLLQAARWLDREEEMGTLLRLLQAARDPDPQE